MNPFDFTNFRVIPPPSRGISLSEVRIAPTSFVFSKIAVAELQYAKDVLLLYSEESQKLVVVPSVENPYTLPFCNDEYISSASGKTLKISHKALVKALRAQMNWPATGTYRIPGIIVPDSNYLAFDLNNAEVGKRTATKISPETFLKTCPSIIDIKEHYKPLALPAVS